MGFLDFFSGKSHEERAFAFNRDNGGIIPDYGRRNVKPRTPKLILAYLTKHPSWRQLPKDVLEELSTRISDNSREWAVCEPLHALEVLVLAEFKSSSIKKVFLGVCQDRSPALTSPEAKLHIFAMTFSNLAGECARARTEGADGYSEDMISDRLEDAKLYAEAAFMCDRYYLPAFMPAAWGWALKNGDIDRSVQILEEGSTWGKEMGDVMPHKISHFDREMINDAATYIHYIEQTKLEIMKLR